MPVGRVPRPPRLGLRRRLPVRAAHAAYGGPEGLQRLVDAAHARGPRGVPRRRLQPRRRLRRAGASRRSAPTSPSATRRSGARRSTTTTPTATRCASGSSRAPRAGSRDFHVDGLRLDAIHAIYDTSAAPRPRRARRARPRGRPRRARDRRERAQRPAGHPARARRAAGLRRRTGPTTSTTRCACCSPAIATATTRSSARWPIWPRPTIARSCTTAVLDLPSAPLRRARGRPPPEQFVVFDSEPRPGRQPRAGRPPARRERARWPRCARCSPPSRRCSSWARSTASRRPSSSSPTTSTPRSPTPRARAAAASSPPSPSSRARRCPTRRTPRPSSAPSSPAASDRRAARRSTASCWRCGASWATSEARGPGLRRGRQAGCASGAATSSWRCNFASEARWVPAAGTRAWSWRPHPRSCGTTARRAPAAAGRGAAVTRGLAGRPFPLGATWDGEGTNFSLFSEHAERVELCLFDDDGRREARRAARVHGLQLARLPARRRARAALRLPRPRALRAGGGAPLQPRQAADRPLRQGDRGPGALGRGQRPALRARRHRGRRPRASTTRTTRAAIPKSVVVDTALRLGGRPPAADARGTRRSSTRPT